MQQAKNESEQELSRKGRDLKIELRCPTCGKDYLLNPTHLRGRSHASFMCNRCGVSFQQDFVLPPSATTTPASGSEEPQPKTEVAAPPRRESPWVRRGLMASLSFFGLIAVFLAVQSFRSAVAPAHALPVIRSEVSREQSNGHDLFVFRGAIRNADSHAMSSVEVQVDLFGPDEALLVSHRLRLQPALQSAPESNVALSDIAAQQLSRQFALVPGDTATFSVPLFLGAHETPTSYTIRAFGKS